MKKQKETTSANNVIVSGNTQVCNSVTRNDNTTNVNNVLSQERERVPTNVSKTSGENSMVNFTSQALARSNDTSTDKKQVHIIKHKDKHVENSGGQQQQESAVNNSAVGKISVVPTAQLMAQKPAKIPVEKFNLMELTNSSLSITPVNDYHKVSGKTTETKKDVVSITACSETISHSKTNEIPQVGHHSAYRQDTSYSSGQTMKHRYLHENSDVKGEKRLDDKDVDVVNKTDKKEKRREKCIDMKHKSSHEAKKKKRDSKTIDQQIGPISQDVVPMPQQTTLSKEEQEQIQNEETIAATNFLSQIITNDDASPRGTTDKRKDAFIADDTLVQTTEQEKNVQMVMKSLKELQELQERKYSPSHSPVGGAIQKPGKSNAQYITFPEEYQRMYVKKEDKLRSKEDSQW